MPARRGGTRPRRRRGFTLIELMVVIALIAIATGITSLSLRDPSASRLEQEAARLATLLETARAESRASGLTVHWEPSTEGGGFRFVGLPATAGLPERWLNVGVSAQVVGARAVPLGPEPLIGAQRIVLALGDRRLVLSTDGLGPFAVVGTE